MDLEVTVDRIRARCEMPESFENTIREVREKVDIVDLVGRHVTLRRSGRQFKGLCPFHGEKTPSFYVDPVRRRFNCFGCSEHGDAIDFVQKSEGVSFNEALRTLAARYGVALAHRSEGEARQEVEREQQRDAAYRITRAATELYREILQAGPLGAAGRAYLHERAIDEETAEAMRIGYAPHPTEGGWDTLARRLEEKRLPMDLAEELGLIARSERTGKPFDRFRGRLLFPIIGAGGSVLAFSGRVLPQFEDEGDAKAPKYLNSPESFLFKKSKTLFGLHRAGRRMSETGRAILVEGNVDVVTMHRHGFTETVAPLGTALTQVQCQILARYVEQVVLCFDGDLAGTGATRKSIPLLLEEGLEVRVVTLDPGEDPDSADPARLAGLLANPMPALEWRMREMVRAGATESIDSQARALRALVPLLKLVKGKDARGDYCVLASNLLQLPIRRIWTAVEGSGPSSGSHPPPPVHSAPMRPQAPLPRGQLELTALLVDRPDIARVAERSGAVEAIDDPRLAPIVRRIVDAARNGDPIPGEGELLDLVESSCRALLHEHVFAGTFAAIEDTQSALESTLQRCSTEVLERDIARIDDDSRAARERGDHDEIRRLTTLRVELRRRQMMMKPSAN